MGLAGWEPRDWRSQVLSPPAHLFSLVPPTVQIQWEINRSQSPGRLNKDCTTALFPEGRSGRSTDDFHSEITYLSDIFRALLHFKLPSKTGCQFFFLSIHFCVLFWNETHSSLKFSIPFFLGQYLYEIGCLKALHLLIKVWLTESNFKIVIPRV